MFFNGLFPSSRLRALRLFALVGLASMTIPPAAMAAPEFGPWRFPSRDTSTTFEGIINDVAVFQGQIIMAGDFVVTRHNQSFEDLVIYNDGFFIPILENYDPEGWIECLYEKDGHLFFGGRFRRVNGMQVRNLAAWYMGLTPLAVGDGLPGIVQSIGEFQGDLVATTSFASRTGDPNLLHTWNENLWSHVEMPADIDFGAARTLLDRGAELWVGGTFLADGDTPHTGRSVLAWNGSTWSTPGDGLRSDSDSSFETEIDGMIGVAHLVEFGGEVYAGGSFHDPARDLFGLARWNGTAWSALPARGFVSGWATMENGVVPLGLVEVETSTDVFVEAPMRWDGSQWNALGLDGGTTLGQVPHRGAVHEGSLHLVGDSRATYDDPYGALSFVSWDGTHWTHGIGHANVVGDIHAMLVHEGEVVFGGEFRQAGVFASPYMAAWTDAGFRPLSAGLAEANCDRIGTSVWSLLRYDDTLIAGGNFDLDGLGEHNVAQWDGQRWQPLGSGVQDDSPSDYYGVTSGVFSMVEFEGKLVVGGQFTRAGGVPARSLASWDGATWTAHPPGPDPVSDGQGGFDPGRVGRLILHQGQLVMSGGFEQVDGVDVGPIARWNGSAWEAMAPDAAGSISLLASWRDALYYAESAGMASARILRRTDTETTEIVPSAPNTSYWTHLATQDDLLIGGPQGLWTWDGSTFTKLLEEPVTRMAVRQHRLYAATSQFEGSAQFLSRFAWAPLTNVVAAVTLDLQADLVADQVQLRWTVSQPGILDGLRLERRCDNCLWETLREGGALAGTTGWSDEVPHPGLWSYRLIAMVDGNRIESSPVTLDTRGANASPQKSYVRSVRPNPFNGSTTVEFTVAKRGAVSAEVYSLDGRRVAESDLGQKDVGNHTFTWNGRDDSGRSVASGVYVLRLRTADQVMTRRVAYVK